MEKVIKIIAIRSFALASAPAFYQCPILCYNESMYNWSTDTKELSKNKEEYAIWQLEQKINYGIGSKKLKRQDVKKYWKRLRIDPNRRKFLDLLLHGR